MFPEICEPLRSLAEWRDFRAAVPQFGDAGYVERVVAAVREGGLVDPLLGYAAGAKIGITRGNYRESLTYKGFNCRRRAITLFVAQRLLETGAATRVYAPEASTAFARVLGALTDFHGSEYRPSLGMRLRNPRVVHQDVLNLGYPDRSFDLYISCEVMEHVTDIPRKLREARRVLKPGGELLATFPFAYGREDSEARAVKEDGRIVHLAPSEYHGRNRHLVYTVPAWDILDVARAAGFETAEMLAVSSRRHGIVGHELAAIFVMRARVAGVIAREKI